MLHTGMLLLADGYIKLRVTPQYIEQSGNWVTVKWSGVSNPSDADWIGVYSPPVDDSYPIDPVNHAPIKYQVFIPTRCSDGLHLCKI